MRPPAQQTDWSDNVAQQLRPTMLIGLGGSGKDVLLRVRRLFYERQGKNADGTVGYPIIGYLVLDTDPGSQRIIEGESSKDFVLKSIGLREAGLREFINCSMSGHEVAKYFQGREIQYPHIFRWLRPEVEKFGAAGTAAATGAGQNRQLARLAFFHHFDAIRDTVDRHIGEVLRQARDPNLVHRWKPPLADVNPDGLDVVLVYSLAGGTGAGMFLDMGMLARAIVESRALKGLRPFFTHFVLLPRPFLRAPAKDQKGPQLAPEEQDKIQENAYAALREMEYFSMRAAQTFDLTIPPDLEASGQASPTGTPWYEVQWKRDDRPYSLASAPWDICCLVGGSNDPLGDSIPYQDVYQMTAEYIFLDFDPNDFGKRRRQRRPNLQGRLLAQASYQLRGEGGELYKHAVSRRYSTFGLSQIYFDRARMRRAASYRLAASLIDHWMRNLELAPPTRKQLAVSDVIQGTLLPGETGFPIALTWERVRDLLLIKDRKTDRQLTWLSDVEDDARQLRDRLGNPAQEGYGNAGWVDALLALHHERLRRDDRGGKEGVARESALANTKTVKEEIEERLLRLFLGRVQELGVPETRKLFEEYVELIQPQIKAADQWTRARVVPPTLWHERMTEAALLPNWLLLLHPARQAQQAELLRAVKEVAKYLRNRYTFEVSELTRDCLQSAAARIGRTDATETEARGSYHELLGRFTDLQNRARGYLEARFVELRKDDQAPGRTRGLLERWDAETYDREIRAFLTEGKEGRRFMQEVEAKVLTQLREQKDKAEMGKWDHVDSLGQLILQVLSARTARVPEEEFAEDLASACGPLLERFCKDRSALELFNADPARQQETLGVLATYSAPFLRRSGAAGEAEGGDTMSLIDLGLAEHNSEAARRFQRHLISTARDQDLSGQQPCSTQNDAIILCQEKHGLPLLYYQSLEAMGQKYYKSVQMPERHFDFAYLQDRLPEIRMISFEKQKQLGNCLELTLQGIMTGILEWKEEQSREGQPRKGQFWLSYRTSQYAPPQSRPQGSRMENLIQCYAEDGIEKQELTRQVNVWIQSSKQNGDGHRLALLLCAVEDLVAEVGRRVNYLLRKGLTTQPEHPLVVILCSDKPDYTGLLPRLREHLGGLPNGSRWLRSRIDRHYIVNECPTSDQPAMLAERERILRGCYQPVLPDGLPIRVIRSDAKLHLDEVQSAGNGAARPARIPTAHRERGEDGEVAG